MGINHATDPRRTCLRLDLWPEADRQAWEQATRPGDILDGTVGPAYHWSPATREKYRKGYGRWLTFLHHHDLFDPVHTPAGRVTEDTIRLYLAELRKTVSSWTTWGRLAELLAAIKVIAPAEDWSWLRAVVRHLESNVKPSRNKLARLRPAAEIATWAHDEMNRILKDPPKQNADTCYRDSLMIGLLITCPTMRLGNLAMIAIGTHLIRHSEHYRLAFQASETKTRKRLDIPVPKWLTPYLDHYIDVVRPRLPCHVETDRLWITRYGRPMRGKTIHHRISTTTKRAFGVPINPHLFRDCAVTSVAIDDPTHIGIAAPLLGHTDPRTTEKHYIQAQGLSAARNYRASVDGLRRHLQPRLTRDDLIQGD